MSMVCQWDGSFDIVNGTVLLTLLVHVNGTVLLTC